MNETRKKLFFYHFYVENKSKHHEGFTNHIFFKLFSICYQIKHAVLMIVTKNSSRMFLSHLKSCKNILIEVADFAIYFLIQKMLPYELDYDYIMIMDSNEQCYEKISFHFLRKYKSFLRRPIP